MNESLTKPLQMMAKRNTTHREPLTPQSFLDSWGSVLGALGTFIALSFSAGMFIQSLLCKIDKNQLISEHQNSLAELREEYKANNIASLQEEINKITEKLDDIKN